MAHQIVYALNFSGWKRGPLRLCFPESEVRFVSGLDQVPDNAVIAVWGMHQVPEACERGIRLVRVEDGFLRSVGLGADLIRPLSWVVDGRGIYYNAQQASDLEALLLETAFDAELLVRARRLRERIVSLGLTKYNVSGRKAWRRPTAGRVILVPGQVESDASLAFGAPGIRRNMDLLRAAREANPGAYIVYKTHPDVVARLRAQGQGEQFALQWCDEILGDAPMHQVLDAVDEVHVMTSLAGFEALLRGKKVTCYGLPFYAGWGLTVDVLSCPRRSRRLSLDELVAGALILYPLYFDRAGRRRITPEEALDELVVWRREADTAWHWWRGLYRMVLRLVVGVR